jgi:hypothetical protein
MNNKRNLPGFNQNAEQAGENQQPQQKEMALVVDLDTGSKEAWKKNLSRQATTTLGTEENKNRSEARDLKRPGTDCSVTDRRDEEMDDEGRRKRD